MLKYFRSLKKVMLVCAFAACAPFAHGVVTNYSVAVDLDSPTTTPTGIVFDSVRGMLTGDTDGPVLGAGVLDCFQGQTCEITSGMFEFFNGGLLTAQLNFMLDDVFNNFGQFVGTLTQTGVMGSTDIVLLIETFAYDHIGLGDGCAKTDDTICIFGGMSLLTDVTGNGGTADDTLLASIPGIPGEPIGAPGQAVSFPGGSFDINPKTTSVPAPAPLGLMMVGLLGLMLRRRLS